MPLKKISAARLFSTLLLAFALILNATTYSARAQEAQRDRRVNPLPAPQATPTTTTVTTPTPQATPTPQPTPQPTPNPALAAALALPAPRTVEVLRARINEVLSQPALAHALFGIKVVSLDTGRVLFEEDAGKLLVPASNMKIYTVAAALARLGPDFRFTTSIYAWEAPDKKGKLRGDLIVYGRGDPTFATRFNGVGNTDYFKAIDDLAARIAAAGIKQIDGDIVGDESYFTGPPRGASWEWDDLQWYYGADVSALTVNDNAIDLTVKPGAKAGDQCIVSAGPDIARIINAGVYKLSGAPPISVAAPPDNAPLTIVNLTTTTARATKRELVVDRPLGQHGLIVSGSLPLDDPGYTASVSVPRPAYAFVTMLRSALAKRGVTVKGRTNVVDGYLRKSAPLDMTKLVEIAKRESPPFSEIAAHTMKPSQNLYTELILRTLGKQFPSTDPKLTSAQAGTSVVRAFLNEAGVANSHLALVDGSGLARQNLITAEATVQLLAYMNQHRYAGVWRDAQPVAGVDGTLRGRMRGTVAAGNLRAKTGTLSNVSGLSGYVTSAAGERLAFSMLVNHYPDDQPPRQNYMDIIAVLLASFEGKTLESDK